jgi:hypothetical protein
MLPITIGSECLLINGEYKSILMGNNKWKVIQQLFLGVV